MIFTDHKYQPIRIADGYDVLSKCCDMGKPTPGGWPSALLVRQDPHRTATASRGADFGGHGGHGALVANMAKMD